MHRLIACIPLILVACAAQPRTADPSAEAEVRDVLGALYASFDFDAQAEPDWQTMRELFLDGAAFVPPIAPGSQPEAVDTEAFLASFAQWVREGEFAPTGLYERILATRIDIHGAVAHAWVRFEGYLPESGEVQTLGIDSLQLARTPSGWRVVSFLTHYER